MNRSLASCLVSSVGVVLACSPSAPVTVTVSPSSANVLTCSATKLTATVAGATNTSVTWSIDPATAGSVDATGNYTSPLQTPNPSLVSVKATSVADPTASGSAQLTLATAFPNALPPIPATWAQEGLYTRWLAAKDQNVYAAWPVQTQGSGATSIVVSRSTDGGNTFAAAKTALTLTMDTVNDSSQYIDCTAIATDAGNADVVYGYARISGSNDLAKSVGTDGGLTTLVFFVSTDGGGTFQHDVLLVKGQSGVGICGDVASPAPNQVVVEAPGAYGCDANPDMWVWADSNKGAGFSAGTGDQSSWVGGGYTSALDDLNGGGNCAHIQVSQNGGTGQAGGTSEAPRLFTDGNGRVCVSYVGEVPQSPSSNSPINAYVQCSDDGGHTFSKPLVLDPGTAPYIDHSQAVGALGPNKRAAVVWNQGGTDNGDNLWIATSTDGATTFGAPVQVPTYVLPSTTASSPTTSPSIAYDASGVLWLAYHVYDGGLKDRVVVDKSCDDGKTWSGAVLVNGPEGAITDMLVPALVATSGNAPHLVATATDHLAYFSLAP